VETTVIEVPVELEPAMETLVAACKRAVSRAEQNRRLDSLALEGELREAARACECAALAAVVRAVDIDAPRIRVEGKVLFRVGRFETTSVRLARSRSRGLCIGRSATARPSIRSR
jgi:hypothetical protein